MSKLFSILFSALILVQSTNIGFDDISKLNALLEHAKYHQETYGDSFFEFMTEHYGKDMLQHQNEHEEHEHLPFKHKPDGTHLAFHFTLNHPFTISEIQHNLAQIPLNYFYKELSSKYQKSDILQPPQLS